VSNCNPDFTRSGISMLRLLFCISAIFLTACSPSAHPICSFSAASGEIVEVQLRRYSNIALMVLSVAGRNSTTNYYQLAECPRRTFGGLSISIESADEIHFWIIVKYDDGVSRAYLDLSNQAFYTQSGKVEGASKTPDVTSTLYVPASMPPPPKDVISIFSGNIVEK
jgi:hypothetical protein